MQLSLPKAVGGLDAVLLEYFQETLSKRFQEKFLHVGCHCAKENNNKTPNSGWYSFGKIHYCRISLTTYMTLKNLTLMPEFSYL